jgi:hypothetical protein
MSAENHCSNKTNSMEHSPSWEATGPQSVKKLPHSMEPKGSLSHSLSAYHLSLSWAWVIQSLPPHPTSLRFILMLSSHLCPGSPFLINYILTVFWDMLTCWWLFVTSLSEQLAPSTFRVARKSKKCKLLGEMVALNMSRTGLATVVVRWYNMQHCGAEVGGVMDTARQWIWKRNGTMGGRKK